MVYLSPDYQPCQVWRIFLLPLRGIKHLCQKLGIGHRVLCNSTPDGAILIGAEACQDISGGGGVLRNIGGHDRIHIVGEVPYAQIRDYYAHAELFVFPSYLETFGHPLLEAMASDLPVVASDIGVFREICDDAALYVDPHDASSIAQAMEGALFSLELRETMAKRGKRRVQEFTWDRSAERLRALFETVLVESVAKGSR